MLEGIDLGKIDKIALEKARSEGKKIGLVQGSWDQFHIGHLRYIKKAKENCDYLIVGIDSDAKIQKRKGKNRPLIPENERYEMIKELGVAKIGKYVPGESIADDIVIKPVDEVKWGLIKEVKPDVLITITENYTTEEYNALTEICSSVLVLPRQAETSTSDKVRRKLIANMSDKVENFNERFSQAVEQTRDRIKSNIDTEAMPLKGMMEHLSDSSDWVTPVVASTKIKDKWYYGTNQSDYNLPKSDLSNRTELFYSTTEHAEINLLKRIGEIGEVDTIYVSLFPCDKCMKTLIDKGIKTIYYLEDHLDKNWSKRSHELASKKGVKVINLLEKEKINDSSINITSINEEIDYSKYKFIYPPNARKQEQLDIMIEKEKNGIDPLDPKYIDQENQPTLFETEYWNVSKNRFPYEGAQEQFLIVARNPIYKIEDLTEEMRLDLFNIWERLKEEYNMDGGAFCFRYGNPAKSGASLKRLHAHLIMPKEDEKVRFPVGGHKILSKELKITE